MLPVLVLVPGFLGFHIDSTGTRTLPRLAGGELIYRSNHELDW